MFAMAMVIIMAIISAFSCQQNNSETLLRAVSINFYTRITITIRTTFDGGYMTDVQCWCFPSSLTIAACKSKKRLYSLHLTYCYNLVLCLSLTVSLACPPSADNDVHNCIDTIVITNWSEKSGASAAHSGSVTTHYIQRCSDVGCKVDLWEIRLNLGTKRWNILAAFIRWQRKRTLLTIKRSDWVIPGPPFRGILSPPLTSIT